MTSRQGSTAPAGWPAAARLASVQHGAVARRQLRHLGLTDRQIDRASGLGRLHRVHRGVFAVGHSRLSAHGRWSAAVLACGPGAALGYRSAAALWSLRSSSAPTIDVTIRRDSRCHHDGLAIHRHPSCGPDEITEHEGIAVTTVARTLLDLAGVLSDQQLRRAVNQAETLRLFDLGTISALLARHRRHRGAAPLSAVLGAWVVPPRVRSALEAFFPDLCRRHGLPAPIMNGLVDGFEIDALFPDQGVAVELDGFRYHAGRLQRERDYARRARLVAGGWTFLAFTYHQVTAENGRFVAETLGPVLRDGRERR